MPFCPNCKVEYRVGFTKCSDCDAELVERLPTEDDGALDMVEAGTIDDPEFGKMVCEALENEGIRCTLTGVGIEAGMLPGGSSPTREVRVMVPRKHIPRAREVMDAFFTNDLFSEDAEYTVCENCGAAVNEEDDVCPACGEPLED